ncbi:MAG: phosphomannomutase/phosphoglucomutase, partial [Burkholderiaceae bacterium]
MSKATLTPGIFKAYDIRGVLGSTLDTAIAEQIGRAFGTAVNAKGEHTVVIGRDGRLSGPELSAALAKGLQAAGIDVIDIGMVATPMLYYATHQLAAHSGIMVTGSHNPPDYNGFKMVLSREAIYGEAIQSLYRRIQTQDFSSGQGEYTQHTIRDAYLERILSDVKLARPMKIVIDCGNGVAGSIAGDLYRALGCEVTELYCEVDGNFP